MQITQHAGYGHANWTAQHGWISYLWCNAAWHTVRAPILPHAVPVARPLLYMPHTWLPIECVAQQCSFNVAAPRKAKKPGQGAYCLA